MAEDLGYSTVRDAARDPAFMALESLKETWLLGPEQTPLGPEPDDQFPNLDVTYLGGRTLQFDGNSSVALNEGKQTYVANALLVAARRAGAAISMKDLVVFWGDVGPRAASDYIQVARDCVAALNDASSNLDQPLFEVSEDLAGPIFTAQYNVCPRAVKDTARPPQGVSRQVIELPPALGHRRQQRVRPRQEPANARMQQELAALQLKMAQQAQELTQARQEADRHKEALAEAHQEVGSKQQELVETREDLDRHKKELTTARQNAAQQEKELAAIQQEADDQASRAARVVGVLRKSFEEAATQDAADAETRGSRLAEAAIAAVQKATDLRVEAAYYHGLEEGQQGQGALRARVTELVGELAALQAKYDSAQDNTQVMPEQLSDPQRSYEALSLQQETLDLPTISGKYRLIRALLRKRNLGAISYHVGTDDEMLGLHCDKYELEDTFENYFHNASLLVHKQHRVTIRTEIAHHANTEGQVGSNSNDRVLRRHLRAIHRGYGLMMTREGAKTFEEVATDLEAQPHYRKALIEAAVAYEKVWLAKRYLVVDAIGPRASLQRKEALYQTYDDILCDAIDTFDYEDMSLDFDKYFRTKLMDYVTNERTNQKQ